MMHLLRSQRKYPYVLGRASVHVVLLASLVGCKLKPGNNMEEGPSAHPAYKPSAMFLDGTTARPVPNGTVIAAEAPGHPYAAVSTTLPATFDSPDEMASIPFPITKDVITNGQKQFEIFCAVCHGRLGTGAGMIPQRGLTPPPSFHIDRLRNASDGHFYNVISNGYGQMFSYNDRVRPTERWQIVAYIRALQASTSQENHLARLTEADRRQLQGGRP